MSNKTIDWRSLCYGVDKAMDAPEPAYIFPGHVFYQPMKRNRTGNVRSKRDKKEKETWKAEDRSH